MARFQIILRNDKTKLYDKFAIFIFLLNGIGLILASLYSRQNINGRSVVAVLLILATALMITPSWIIIRKKSSSFESVLITSSVSILIFWICLGYWWIGLLVFFLIILYRYSKRELVVKLTTEKILYPSFPLKSIPWNDLNNVILKDRLLTIDFKNNKLIQQDIDIKSYAVIEQDFNDFCRQQLITSNQ